jgi:hypothetical protein
MTVEIKGLLPSQIAELGKAIARAKLNAREFEPDEFDDFSYAGYSPVPTLRHTPTRSWFGFARYYAMGRRASVEEYGFRAGLAPGKESPFEERGPLDWNGTLAAFQEWLTYVQREAGTVDFLEAFEAERATIAAVDSEADDLPFTPDEQQHIAPQLDAIEEEIVEAVRPNAEFETFVRAEFTFLRAELGKMRRGQWRKLFYGTLINFAARAMVPPEIVRKALEAAKDFFVDHVLPLLPGVRG